MAKWHAPDTSPIVSLFISGPFQVVRTSRVGQLTRSAKPHSQFGQQLMCALETPLCMCTLAGRVECAQRTAQFFLGPKASIESCMRSFMRTTRRSKYSMSEATELLGPAGA